MTFYQSNQMTPDSSMMGGELSELQVIAGEHLDAPGSYEQSRKCVSSVVVAEEILGEVPERNKITYIDVPVVQEVIEYVSKPTIVEVEKIVPRYEVEETEVIEEVLQVEYIDHPVEKIIKHEPGTKLIEEVQKEVVKYVPIIQTKEIEKVVEISGDLIEVPVIKRNAGTEGQESSPDKEIPVVVAQTIRPVLTEVYDQQEKVDVYAYKPKAVYVDVFVPKPVQSQLVPVGAINEEYKAVSVPPCHYNTLLKHLNQHLPEEDVVYLPFQNDPEYNKVTFLHPVHTPGIVNNPELDYIPLTEEDQMGMVQDANLNDSSGNLSAQNSMGSQYMKNSSGEKGVDSLSGTNLPAYMQNANVIHKNPSSFTSIENPENVSQRLISKNSNYQSGYNAPNTSNYRLISSNVSDRMKSVTQNPSYVYGENSQPTQEYQTCKDTDGSYRNVSQYNTMHNFSTETEDELFNQTGLESITESSFHVKPNRGGLIKRLSCGC